MKRTLSSFRAGFAGIACTALALILSCSPAKSATLQPSGRWTAHNAGAASTPPMGWNSWNAFRTEINEEKVRGAARALVDTGLAKLGYTYVNIDDGWWLKRRQSDGRLKIRTALFPSAKIKGRDSSFKPFVDHIHGLGLKAGIYTDIGRNACSQAWDLHSPNLPEGTVAEREVGLEGHVDQDLKLFFQDWGFDYVKVDACGVADYAQDAKVVASEGYRPRDLLIVRKHPALDRSNELKGMYEKVAETLQKYNPDGDYVLSICTWGRGDVRQWGQAVGNSWRTSSDIRATWSSMLGTFDSAATRALYARPGAWNDPDMLFVGTGEFDVTHLTEARSHFSLWAMINAPLLIGYDLRGAPKELLDIWGNADLIAINQDPAGNQAVLAYRSDDVQIFVKTLSSGKKAVALFNRGTSPYKVALTAGHLKFDAKAPVTLRNLWTKETLAPFTREAAFELAPRETLVFEAEGTHLLGEGGYLSEMPARIHVAVDGTSLSEPDPEAHRTTNQGATGVNESTAYGGWGGAQADASPYSTELTVATTSFPYGVGILANSRMEVKADGYGQFETSVGVDNATRNRDAAVTFEVYGDGRPLARSQPVRFGDAPIALTASVRGMKVIELVARTDATTPVAVTWGAARLTK